MEQQAIGHQAIVHNTVADADGNCQLIAEVVFGGSYHCATMPIPAFLRSQMANPEAIETATRVELERTIYANVDAGSGTAALSVIMGQREEIARLNRVVQAQIDQGTKLRQALDAAEATIKRLQEENTIKPESGAACEAQSRAAE